MLAVERGRAASPNRAYRFSRLRPLAMEKPREHLRLYFAEKYARRLPITTGIDRVSAVTHPSGCEEPFADEAIEGPCGTCGGQQPFDTDFPTPHRPAYSTAKSLAVCRNLRDQEARRAAVSELPSFSTPSEQRSSHRLDALTFWLTRIVRSAVSDVYRPTHKSRRSIPALHPKRCEAIGLAAGNRLPEGAFV